MNKFSLNQRIVLTTVALGVVLIFIFLRGNYTNPNSSSSTTPKAFSSTQTNQNDKPQIVATKPDPLDDNIVSGTDTIEITFNRPLQNVGEFKVRIEPKIDYKVELSGDRKTARVIPAKPYPLGASFTLSIGPDTKFDGMGEWRESKDFHFRTIKYTGV